MSEGNSVDGVTWNRTFNLDGAFLARRLTRFNCSAFGSGEAEKRSARLQTSPAGCRDSVLL